MKQFVFVMFVFVIDFHHYFGKLRHQEEITATAMFA